MMGWVSWASGVVDNALYPSMFLTFVEDSFDLHLSAWMQMTVIVLFVCVMTSTNVIGLDVVGAASSFFLVLICLPSMKVSAWLEIPAHVDWVMWTNLALWNTNGWDSTSTFAGEVQDPEKTYPRAIFLAQFFVICPYIVMILASSALDQDFSSYSNGTYNVIAMQYGGTFLGSLFALGTFAAVMGMFVSDMTTYSYQLSGMSEVGMLPKFLSWKYQRFDTPVISIFVCFIFVQLFSQLPFHEILICDNFLYCICLLMELAALVQLRRTHPELPRPFRIPLGTLPLSFMCLLPACFCFFVLLTSSARVILAASLVVGAGMCLYLVMTVLAGRGGGERAYQSLP